MVLCYADRAPGAVRLQKDPRISHICSLDIQGTGMCPLAHIVRPSVLESFFDVDIAVDSWWFQGLIFMGLWVIGHEVRA